MNQIPWKSPVLIDPRLDASEVRLMDPDTALVVGSIRSQDWDLNKQQAAIFRYHAGRLARAYKSQGSVLCVDAVGSTAFAIRAVVKPSRDGSDYVLLRSNDSGETWQERGVIPAKSIVRVHAVSEQEVWALGAETLLHSADSGLTWKAEEVPGRRNPFEEKIIQLPKGCALAGAGVLLLAPTLGLPLIPPRVTVVAMAENYVLEKALNEKKLEHLRLLVNWTPEAAAVSEFPSNLNVFRFVARGLTIKFIAITHEKNKPPGPIAVYESYDGGNSWSTLTLPGSAVSYLADLDLDGHLVAINPSHHVVATF